MDPLTAFDLGRLEDRPISDTVPCEAIRAAQRDDVIAQQREDEKPVVGCEKTRDGDIVRRGAAAILGLDYSAVLLPGDAVA